MGKKLYVGGLSYSTTEETLNSLFSQAGTVESAKVITDRDSGRSKGFGFVEMASQQEAEEAVKKFNGHNLDGRQITVNEARPEGSSRRGSGGGGGGGGGGGRGGRGDRGGSGGNRW